jgi:hypothetical protein
MKPVPLRIADLRGIHRLAADATVGITDLVEAMHATILRTPGVLRHRTAGRTSGITGLVYRSVRGVTRLVGTGGDALLEAIGRRVADRASSPEREAALAALNGVFGDYLAESGNPLAIAMAVRAQGAAVPLSTAALRTAFPSPSPRLLVLVHGLCMNDLQWSRRGQDHGAALAAELGFTPVYLHYNTGRHISANGREFAATMATLVREWPQPIEQLAVLAHSMGGLVVRSGCHYAALAGDAWLERLQRIVFLGTPHFGAPLERAGAIVDALMQVSPYSAPFARLGKSRSAGIMDLGHAHLRDEDWQAKHAVATRRAGASLPLPRGSRCFAIAASRQKHPGPGKRGMRGDGLVPVDSALGRSSDPRRDLGIPDDRRWIGHGMSHFDLLDRPEVYAKIRHWLAGDDASNDDVAPRGGVTPIPAVGSADHDKATG